MRSVVLLLLLAGACASAPPEPGITKAPPPVLPGLTVLPAAAGPLADYPPVRDAQGELANACRKGAATVQRRLGLALDPDRPRRIAITDRRTVPTLETLLIDGRMVQTIEIPAVPLARGNVPLTEMVTEAIARAAISDVLPEELPGWYIAGAPLWVSGSWERILSRRVLGGPVVPERVNDVAPPLRASGSTDPLTGAIFFRFVGEEFGAEKIPALTRALLSADQPEDAVAAALRADPVSLPVAFDGYRTRSVADFLSNDYVRLLAASRSRTPAQRIPALSGLSMRAPNRFVAAALLEELALAQFEAGEFAASARTFATVEQEYPQWATSPDRDLLYFALTFARQGDVPGARIRIESFLAEYRESAYGSLALFELAALLMKSGNTDEAVKRYGQLVERFPDSPHARPSRVILATAEATRHRYALARSLFTAALPDRAAVAGLSEIDEIEKKGLPDAARPMIRAAVRDLVAADPLRGERGAKALLDIGPAAKDVLAEEFSGRRVLDWPPKIRMRALAVLASWPRESVWPDPLQVFLAGEDAGAARAVFAVLDRFGISESEIEIALGASPNPTPAATAEFDRRFRAEAKTDALLESTSFRDRMLAATRLATEDRDDAVTLLAGMLADPSPQVRRVTAAALGERAEKPEARAALAVAIEDDSRLVRIQVYRSCARLGDLNVSRSRGLGDEDPLVRIESARDLFILGDERDLSLVLALVNDTESTVRTSVETILRSNPPEGLGSALAGALRGAEMPGHASRIVRVMSHHTGTDFGYDRYGGKKERDRVADAFLRAWAARAH